MYLVMVQAYPPFMGIDALSILWTDERLSERLLFADLARSLDGIESCG